ncbi:hypothetical protein DV515_00019380, partial [Chloebia gouldiae]
MAKGLRRMRLALRRADCLVEVHDARISSTAAGEPCPLSLRTTLAPLRLLSIPLPRSHIPLSGRNPALQEALGIRPHVLVLNKMDLADARRQPAVLEQLRQRGCSHVVFTDCQRDVNVKKSSEHNILVIGVPNVGKSSLINSLRRLHLKKGRATAVGGEPGITKAVLSRIQVCEKPLMYLVDTPGVLPPRLGDVETGMKLALCGAIHDHLVGEDIMADYLLYTLNKQQQFRYVQHYGLGQPCDHIEPLLKHVALSQGRTQKVKVLTGTGNVNMMMLNYPAAAYEFLRDFRAGRLGR